MHASRLPDRNLLLRSLSPSDRASLDPHLETVPLHRGMVLTQSDAPISRLFFPQGGVASVIARGKDGTETEAGIIGWEGVAPCAVILGVDTYPHDIMVQIDDSDALAMPASVLRDLMRESHSLRETLQRYAAAFLEQTVSTVASNANDPVEARLARWLLMCHDRVDGNEIEITHEFLGMMLGVRRASVTVALHVLEGMGAIRSTRGLVTVTDRDCLADLAADSYGRAEAEYRKLVGPFPAKEVRAGASASGAHASSSPPRDGQASAQA